MSQGDLADAARTGSSGGVAGNITDATIPAIAGGNKNSNITTELKSNTEHVPYVASGPDVRNTSRTSAMQPRSGYKANDGPKYFDPYDPWIGIRTAAILGGFLMLIVVYILYKARCRLSGSIEVTKVSYYQEYKDRCRERILSNIRARNNMANSIDRSHHHQGGDGVTSLDLTAKWIQSQPLCSAIPDESSEVKTPNLNRMQNRLHLSNIQLQTSSPDLRSPGGRERSKALLQLLRESNQDHFPINHRNFTAIGEFPICDGKVPNTDVANSSDLTYLSGQSPPLSNTHYHVPLIHNAGHKDSDPSIDENSNLPSTKLNADSVQIEMVPLSSHKDSSDTDERDSNSVKSVKSVASDRTPEQRTVSHGTPLTNDSRVRSQSHSSLIPSASSMSSGLELVDPLRLITANGGPKLHKKSRSNGNIVTMKLDSQYALWRPPNNTVTKL